MLTASLADPMPSRVRGDVLGEGGGQSGRIKELGGGWVRGEEKKKFLGQRIFQPKAANQMNSESVNGLDRPRGMGEGYQRSKAVA